MLDVGLCFALADRGSITVLEAALACDPPVHFSCCSGNVQATPPPAAAAVEEDGPRGQLDAPPMSGPADPNHRHQATAALPPCPHDEWRPFPSVAAAVVALLTSPLADR